MKPTAIAPFLYLLLVISLSSRCALALDADKDVLDANAHPTTQELYEDCKVALKMADTGNKRGFMQSQCGVFMQGMYLGQMSLVAQLLPPISEQFNKETFKKCPADVHSKTKNPSTIIIETSVALARKFVFAYNKRTVGDYKLENELLSILQAAPAAGGAGMLLDDIILEDTCI
jgi:virulence-associated protein VapD